MVEWHAMTAAQRAANWTELVDWVVWLHDRYELAIEERLPPCWAEHPGLLEELWALKAWRAEIYAGSASAGQAARYWHTELRQTIQAAVSFYAAGCRAGHRRAVMRADAAPDLRRRWLAADPLARVPRALVPGGLDAELMSRVAMGRALATGAAKPLSETVGDIVRYDGGWWRLGPAGWRRVTDVAQARQLDLRATSLAAADAAVAARRRRSVHIPSEV
jgi:hypothetical protein